MAKISAAEDKESRSEAALINLQCALEQFQNGELFAFLAICSVKHSTPIFHIDHPDKERDIAEHTQQLRRQLDAEASAQRDLRSEMDAMRQQLAEAKQGLLAATRISDQLENYQLANANLKDERKYRAAEAFGKYLLMRIWSK